MKNTTSKPEQAIWLFGDWIRYIVIDLALC